MTAEGWSWASAEVGKTAETSVTLTEEEFDALEDLLDILYDSDDVADVYHNAEEEDEEEE